MRRDKKRYMLGDFSLMKNLSQVRYNDNIEGDFKYLANEILYVTDENFKNVDLKKADVFALGMSLIDILTRKFIRGKIAGKRRAMGGPTKMPEKLTLI